MSGKKRPSEYEEVVQLANKILERSHADPDDDLAMLSRQFLRQVEKVERLKKDLAESYDPMAEVIQSNRDEILRRHEEAVRLIRRILAKAQGVHDADTLMDALDDVRKILDALNLFHPMHPETWPGWPQEVTE